MVFAPRTATNFSDSPFVLKYSVIKRSILFLPSLGFSVTTVFFGLQICCYSLLLEGSLNIGPPNGGFVTFPNNPRSAAFEDGDNAERRQCCELGFICDVFYQRRPSDTGVRYVPPRWSKFINNELRVPAISNWSISADFSNSSCLPRDACVLCLTCRSDSA